MKTEKKAHLNQTSYTSIYTNILPFFHRLQHQLHLISFQEHKRVKKSAESRLIQSCHPEECREDSSLRENARVLGSLSVR